MLRPVADTAVVQKFHGERFHQMITDSGSILHGARDELDRQVGVHGKAAGGPSPKRPFRRTRSQWDAELGIVNDSALGGISRQTGDTELDPLFTELLGTQTYDERVEVVRSLLEVSESIDSRVGTWHSTLPNSLPSEIHDFRPTLSHIPNDVLQADSWCRQYWDRHRLPIIGSLFYASLPGCYAAANGAEVLAQTGGMVKRRDLLRRIPRTGEFVATMMMHRLFTENGELNEESDPYRAIRFVRVLHAAVRHMITDPTKPNPWDTAARGVPINQMDMAGTVLAFGLIVDEPFERFVGHTSPNGVDENLFLARWNTVGELLGTQPNLLANDIFDARALLGSIRVEWTESPEGSAGNKLVDALLDYLSSWLGGTEAMNVAMLRHLAPRDVPRLLHVDEGSALIPPVLVTAALSTMQHLAVSSDTAAALGSATFEAGFKGAEIRAAISQFRSEVTHDALSALHVDTLIQHVSHFFFDNKETGGKR
jgi:ER-bound oxygenase mpaB/B'/Rubber oxygenase, catalytic domain